MITPWFFYALGATIFYGLMNFLLKLGAQKGCSSSQLLNRSAATVAFLSGVSLMIFGDNFSFSQVIVYALINSSFFATGNLCKITALKKAPAASVFPVTKLNAAFVIVFSILVYGDRPGIMQWAGIILSFSVLMLAGAKDKSSSNNQFSSERMGVILALCSALCTATSMITGRESSRAVSKLAFMFVSYSLVTLYTFFISRISATSQKNSQKYSLIFGICAGTLNFAGYYLVLSAFASGDMSLIQGIFSNSFIIPIILSALFLKEKLSLRHLIMIVLTSVSVLLIKGL